MSLSGLSALKAIDRLTADSAAALSLSISSPVAVPKAWICAGVASTDSLALKDLPLPKVSKAFDTLSAALSCWTVPHAARPPARTAPQAAAARAVRADRRITVLMGKLLGAGQGCRACDRHHARERYDGTARDG